MSFIGFDLYRKTTVKDREMPSCKTLSIVVSEQKLKFLDHVLLDSEKKGLLKVSHKNYTLTERTTNFPNIPNFIHYKTF